jgi:hypothetical protein
MANGPRRTEMSKFVTKSRRTALRTLAPVVALLGLTACQHQMSGGIDDIYMPQMHYERHPIEVARGTVKLQVPTRSATLNASEQDAVRRLAQQANENNAGQCMYSVLPAAWSAMQWPAGLPSYSSQEGVVPHRIKHASATRVVHTVRSVSRSRASLP